MRFNILSDANWEAKIDHVQRVLDLWNFFYHRNYGNDLSGGIVVVLMCRDPEYKFKQRIRFSKKEQKLYMDIMLDYLNFVTASHAQRRQMVAKHLQTEIPLVIAKYKFKDFDLERFSTDLNHGVSEQLLGADASRFDHLCLERATGI